MLAALPMISAAFAVGIMLAREAAGMFPAGLLVLIGMAMAVVAIVLTQKKKPAIVPLLLLFLCLGMFVSALAQDQVHGSLVPHLGLEREYRGYIEEVLPSDEDMNSFILRVESVTVESDELPLEASVRVSSYLLSPDFEPAYGLRLHIKGTAVAAMGQRNPGGFDYATYLESIGVGAVMSVRGQDISVLSDRGGHLPLLWAHQVRVRARQILAQFLPTTGAGLAGGLLLGERHAVSEETLAAYRRLGIAHLLAVSGLHVGFVAAFALFLTARLFYGRGRHWQALGAALLVVGYVYLTGGRPPVWRAGLTLLLALYARQVGRERDGLQGLAAVALLMLFFRPLWLFSLSFQFSFAATAGILLLAPRLEPHFTFVPARLSGPMAVTIAAQFAVLPLQVLHFGIFSLFAVPVNLLCVPLVGVVMALGLSGVLTGLIFLPLATPFLLMAKPILLLLENIPQALATLPFAAMRIPAVPPAIWLLYLLLVLMFLAEVSIRPLTGKKILAILLTLNVLLFSVLPIWEQRVLEVTFLDVGQGMAIHVQTPSGNHLFIDAGQENQGEYAILPYLRAAGVQSMDLLILTHPHDDHYGGMSAVINDLSVHTFVHNGEGEESEAYTELLAALAKAGVPDVVAQAGSRLVLDDVHLDVLSPPQDKFRYTGDDVNNNSLVIRLTYGDFSLLVTGDAETEALGWLLAQEGQLHHTVLQVPHHGSAGALSPNFLEAVGTQAAVIPVGRNSFGHPRQETLDLLDAHGVAVYRTDLHGAVTVTSDGQHWQVQAFVNSPWE